MNLPIPKEIPTSQYSPFTELEVRTNESILNKKLPPELISHRKGAGGIKLAYIEGWRVINLANQIFGFNGWSSSILNFTVDDLKETPDGRVNLCISAIVRVTLRDGTSHEDIGYGSIENARSKAMAFEKSRKEAATDGLKRALRMFGDVLGNCLYNKSFVSNVGKYAKRANVDEFSENDFYRPNHLQKPPKKLAIEPLPVARPKSNPPPSKPAFSKLPYKASGAQLNIPKPNQVVHKDEFLGILDDFNDLTSQDDLDWDDSFCDALGAIGYENPSSNEGDFNVSNSYPEGSEILNAHPPPVNVTPATSVKSEAVKHIGSALKTTANKPSFDIEPLTNHLVSHNTFSGQNPTLFKPTFAHYPAKSGAQQPTPVTPLNASKPGPNDSPFANIPGFIPASSLKK